MEPHPDAFAGPAPALPAAADVAIVGGGIAGVFAALFLARRGLRVVLCDKGPIAGEQSGRNWGWCRQTLRDPAELPLIAASLRLWDDPATTAGHATGFRRTGIAYLAATAEDEARHAAWAEAAAPFQTGSRLIDPRATAALLPQAARRFRGALYTPGDGGAEPARAVPAAARAAAEAGAAILPFCAVRALDTAAGRVAGIVTERGRISAPAVLVAAGAWSRRFLAPLGIDLPQAQVMGSVMRTAPVAGAPALSLAGPRFGFRPRADGGYTVGQAGATILDILPDSLALLPAFRPAWVREWRRLRLRLGRRFLEEARLPRRWSPDGPSPFEAVRVLDPTPSRPILDEAARELARAFPAFAGMRVLARWGGIIDVTPDQLPVISAVARLPGLWLATGLSGHGFGVGPGVGHLAADLIAGRAPLVDPLPFRWDRFAQRPRVSPTG